LGVVVRIDTVERAIIRSGGLVASLAIAALVAAGTSGCESEPTSPKQAEHMAGKTIQQVQEQHTDQWMAIPGVVGTAIGQCDGKPCILILTASNTEQVRQKIPSTVEGYPVVVQYSGEVRALDK
jgi:hypothetical protein